MSVTITPIYAALLAVLLLLLTRLVIAARRAKRVSLGDGGEDSLQRRIRAHGNFVEYVPMALLLIAFAEMLGAASLIVHALGIGLLVGRIAHASAILPAEMNLTRRIIGMALTLTTIAVAAGTILFLSITR